MSTFIPGKDEKEFRNYETNETVKRHYKLMREKQTVEHVKKMCLKYHKFKNAKMTIKEGFSKLENYVDSSDPDSELPNLVHMMQTAERLRSAGHPDWLQLTGLLHDMGKIMFLWGSSEDGQEGTADGDQWSLGGDTFIVGCKLPDTLVYPEFNSLNPDSKKPEYSSKLGMYERNCGMHNVLFAYGHDEYMYQMLIHNKTTLPEEALAIIRFHSAYAWHDKNSYEEFETEKDRELKKWVIKFNEFDLYTKSDAIPDVQALWPYYQSLIDKYIPGELEW